MTIKIGKDIRVIESVLGSKNIVLNIEYKYDNRKYLAKSY